MIKGKRILLVSSAFYPEISPRSFRATELAKEFFRQGHEVTVISKFRDLDYSAFLKEYPVTFKMWNKPLFPKVPDFKRNPFRILSRLSSRLLSLLFEYPAIEEMFQVRKMLNNEREYDLMISFAVPYPVHWGVAWAKLNQNLIAKVWVADCGDPYMFNQMDTFIKPFYFKFWEVNFCRKCDYITIPFQELKNKFYPEFSSKLVVIPQGFDLGEIRLFEGQIQNEKPVFIFAGSILPGKRDLTLLLDFLSSLTKDFLFIVYTQQPEWFKKYKLILGEKLELRGYIDRLSLIYEMSKADFLVNIDSIFDTQDNLEAVPSKLIDYALSNRPILNLKTNCLDKEMVIKFLHKDYSMQRIIDKSKYDIRNISAKFLELIN